jgi:hypothetical protein
MTFDLGETPICKEIQEGLNKTELENLMQEAQNCPYWSQLDSIQELRKEETLYFQDTLNSNTYNKK